MPSGLTFSFIASQTQAQRSVLCYMVRRFRGDGTAVLTFPAAFTVCTQQLSESGAWLFPAAGSDQWLCARPQ